MLKWKTNVMVALKEKGYTCPYLRKNKIFAESTMAKLRHERTDISANNLDTICRLLEMQPDDLLEWVPDNTEKTS